MALLQQSDAFNPVHSRETDIHQHHAGGIASEALQGRFDGVVNVVTSESWRAAEQEGKAFAYRGLVLDDGDADYFHAESGLGAGDFHLWHSCPARCIDRGHDLRDVRPHQAPAAFA